MKRITVILFLTLSLFGGDPFTSFMAVFTWGIVIDKILKYGNII